MNTRLGTIAFATAFLNVAASIGGHARQAVESNPILSAPSDDERVYLLAKGKAIFAEKCAKCHSERGDKALSSGKPLSDRGLSTAAIERAVNGRLSKGTDEERKAVTLYIASLMKNAAGAETKP